MQIDARYSSDVTASTWNEPMMPSLMTETIDHRDHSRLLDLGRQVGELRAAVAEEGRRIFQGWRPEIHRPSFAASA